MTSFNDHFSATAGAYARHRPTYPPVLVAMLAGRCAGTARVWDCATGNGQAAVALAEHFDAVVATDASAEQIAQAQAHERVTYRVAPAEASRLEDDSVDLVTVAQALHWFDRPAFFAEARRVLRPGGLLAVWTYGPTRVTPALDAIVGTFYGETVGPYWPPERHLPEEGYASIVFPFDDPAVGKRLRLPTFAMTADWHRADFVGYLGTWSAVKRYREATGSDPIPAIDRALAARWPSDETRLVRWPLAVHAGRLF
ncbi:MAG: class I SAM-dependent methyltransferase [Bacteroidota bacterium]